VHTLTTAAKGLVEYDARGFASLYRIRDIRASVPSNGEASRTILDIKALDIPRGQMVAIIGPSGSGKSTLLGFLGMISQPRRERGASLEICFSEFEASADLVRPNAGLVRRLINLLRPDAGLMPRLINFLRPDSGLRKRLSVLLWPKASLKRRFGFVFQSPFLLQDATVGINIAVVERIDGRAPSVEAIRDACENAGLTWDGRDRVDQRVRRLSGGEQQRVALARALARNPDVIIVDEPTASLDPALADEVLSMLRDWVDKEPNRCSVIWVTHRVEDVARFADSVIVLREGRLAPEEQWPRFKPFDVETLRRWMYPAGVVRNRATSPISAEHHRAARLEGAVVIFKLALAQLFNGRSADLKAPPNWLQKLVSYRNVGSYRTIGGVWPSNPLRYPLRASVGIVGALLGLLWYFTPEHGGLVAALVSESAAGVLGFAGILMFFAAATWQTVRAFGAKIELAFVFFAIVSGLLLWKSLNLVNFIADQQLSNPSINPIIVALSTSIATPDMEDKALEAVRRQMSDAQGAETGHPAAQEGWVYARYMNSSVAYARVVAGECGPREPSTARRTWVMDFGEPVFRQLNWSRATPGVSLESPPGDGRGSVVDAQDLNYGRSVAVGVKFAQRFLSDDGKTLARNEVCVFPSGRTDTIVPVKLAVRAILHDFPQDSLTTSVDSDIVAFNGDSAETWTQDMATSGAYAALYFDPQQVNGFLEAFKNAKFGDGTEGVRLLEEPAFRKIREALGAVGLLIRVTQAIVATFLVFVISIVALNGLLFVLRHQKAIAVLQAFSTWMVARLFFVRMIQLCFLTFIATAITLVFAVTVAPELVASYRNLVGNRTALIEVRPSLVIITAVSFSVLTCGVTAITLFANWMAMRSKLGEQLKEVT